MTKTIFTGSIYGFITGILFTIGDMYFGSWQSYDFHTWWEQIVFWPGLKAVHSLFDAGFESIALCVWTGIGVMGLAGAVIGSVLSYAIYRLKHNK